MLDSSFGILDASTEPTGSRPGDMGRAACDNRRMIRRAIGAIVGVFAVSAVLTGFAACAGGRAGSAGDACFNARNAAESRVMKVVTDNQSCAEDADCSMLGVHATCFDRCFWAVNAAGKGAVDRIETMVEAAECKAFHESGCKVEVSSCGPPPATARCEAGKCVDGP